MFAEPIPGRRAGADADSGPWYRGLTRYHWFVLVVAALGWFFDTMDQQLFTLARKPAMAELLGVAQSDPRVEAASGYTTTVFMIGWATGGIIFGILGDRLGRARTMMLTILIYSLCTGLSALSRSVYDFALYRFLTGLGVGGEFAVGVALVAEVMPDRARPYALGLIQALSAVGNMVAGGISIALGMLERAGRIGVDRATGGGMASWRIMFLVGAVPALLALVIRRRLKEPERWAKAAESADVGKPRLGSLAELFGDPRWRRNTIVGMLLAFAGVVGLWGIGFFMPDLVRSIFERRLLAQGQSREQVAGSLFIWTGIGSMVQNAGGFFGVYAFSLATQRVGRKPAFAVSFVLAMAATAYTFWAVARFADIFWMLPLMGFCQMTLFGGYAIYFPELFPTRLRSTGTSFCYNVGRFIAAAGPSVRSLLTGVVFAGSGLVDKSLPLRYAGLTMCSVFLIGLIVLPFAPETKGRPLPE